MKLLYVGIGILFPIYAYAGSRALSPVEDKQTAALSSQQGLSKVMKKDKLPTHADPIQNGPHKVPEMNSQSEKVEKINNSNIAAQVTLLDEWIKDPAVSELSKKRHQNHKEALLDLDRRATKDPKIDVDAEIIHKIDPLYNIFWSPYL